MNLIRDIVLMVLGFVLSIIGALIGATIQRRWDRRRTRRPLNQLLNFGSDDLLFVFPHRTDESNQNPAASYLLPRTSTEDFIAINNFMTVLANSGWERGAHVRDTTRFRADDHKRNLVIVCSPKSNDKAAEFQDALIKKKIVAYYFEKRGDRWCILHPTDSDRPPYESPSWSQEQEYLASGVDRRDLPGKAFTDYAIITKATNPWNPHNKVIWIAGIRGIGTWGAAECVKKRWLDIYNALPKGAKDADFSAIIKVFYDNSDIANTEVVKVIPFRN